MRVAMLGSPESWYYRDLSRAAAERHEVTVLPFTQIAARLAMSDGVRGDEHYSTSGAALDDFDAVLVRTMPPGSLEQVVFRMDALARLESRGALVVNSPRSIEIAVDKYLTSARLVAAGILHPPTIVCQTADDAMQAFDALGGDVVVKPLFGAEGRGIARVSDEAVALRVFKAIAQLGGVLYLQAFIPHAGRDWRVLLVGDRAFGMKRVNDGDWRTNVSRGARTEPLELTAEMVELARRAAAATGATLAGVDLLPARDGGVYVLEVNAVPGWRALARTLDVDIAALVLDELSRELAARPSASRKSSR